MVETGLLIAGDDIPVPYDRFRDRVMFPITDFRGRIIAFGGRALAADAQAKYLNSPETPLFHKGSNLYNGAAARQAVHDGASLIVVEGYVDVIAMVTAGYPATVAPLGTALTEDQLGLLWKMADEPILCFDGDKAGRRAAFRAVDMAMPRLKPGKSLRFAMLPDGQDPDDLYRSGGREAIAEVLPRAQPLGEMLWTRETEAASFDTPERRAAFEARVHEVVRSIGDDLVRKYYAQDFSRAPAAVACAAAAPGRGDARAAPARPAAHSAASPVRQLPRFLPRPGRFRGRAAESARADVAAELAAVREPDRARVPHRAAAARGADPGDGGQPSVAAGAPRRGVFRARVPQSRHRSPAAGGSGCRHRLPCGGPRGAARGDCGAGADRRARPGRGRHHPHLRLAGPAGRFRR